MKPETVISAIQAFAAHYPERPSILGVTGDALDYQSLAKQIEDTVAWMSIAGIRGTDRIGLVLENGPDAAVCCIAVSSCAVCVPFRPSLTAEEFELRFRDLDLAALVFDSRILSPAPAVARTMAIPLVELVPGTTSGIFSFRSGHSITSQQQLNILGTDGPGMIFCEVGPTSQPRLISVPLGSLCHSARINAETLALVPDDRCLSVIPTSDTHGFTFAILSSLFAGSSVVCTPAFVASQFSKWLTSLRPTWYTATPTIHKAVLRQLQAQAYDSSQVPLRFIRSGGNRLSSKLVRELEKALSVPVIDTYATTEAGLIASSPMPPEKRKAGSVGRPVGCEVRVVDPARHPLPTGSIGNIAVRGAGVSGRWEENGNPSAPLPFDDWLYTDDHGRLDPDGYLYVAGRGTDAINRGGERIYPNEIEDILMQHPTVDDAIAFPAPHPSLGEQVAACVVLRSSIAASEVQRLEFDLQELVADRLTMATVPYRIEVVDEIPRDIAGRPDRQNIAAILGFNDIGSALGAESTTRAAIESRLITLWEEVLECNGISTQDEFLDLGGDSISAAQIIGRIGKEFGVSVPAFVIFRTATITGLAEWLESKADTDGRDFVPYAVTARPERLPLSYAQRRLWFLAQMESSEAYHIYRGTRLNGPLDTTALRRALDRIVERHEALRTTFVASDGEPFQQVHPPGLSRFHLIEHNLSSIQDVEIERDKLIAEEVGTTFDLETGPLARGRLIREGEEDYTLIITMHHIVSDGWSMGVFMRELSVLYEAFSRGTVDPLPELEVQYPDYAIWQRTALERRAAHHEQYWKTALSGIPALLELPTDHIRPPKQEFEADSISLQLSKELTEALRDLSKRHGVTLFMTMLAGWMSLLFRLSGQTDIVIGTPAANRERLEFEGLIGFFVNTLALRGDLSGSPTISQLLQRVKKQVLAAQQHLDVPFERVVEAVQPMRSVAYTPIFQVAFAWQNVLEGALRFPSVETTPLSSAQNTTKFDLTLLLEECGDHISGRLEYATSLFLHSTVERYWEYFQNLLHEMVADTKVALDRLPILPEEERHQLEAWNSTRLLDKEQLCVHELFEIQAHSSPDAVALALDDIHLTYAELNRRATQLSVRLRNLGVRSDARVGICADRSIEMIIATLGVLKAGGGYVPLDPEYPADRIRYIIEDSEPDILLCQTRYLDRLKAINATLPLLNLSADVLSWRHETETEFSSGFGQVSSDNLAYVIYTSGSTGTPKGVMVTHHNVVNLVRSTNYIDFQASHTIAHAASVSFDASTFEIWGALLNGGSVRIISRLDALSPQQFELQLKRFSISTVFLTTALFNECARHNPRMFSGLNLLFGGEASDSGCTERVLKDASPRRLIQVYGPTEATTFASHFLVRTVDSAKRIPIGHPVAGARLYVLNEKGELAPVGVTGELYIGGLGLSRGYQRRPDATADRFVCDPYADNPGSRMYRTGDLVRRLPEGGLEFLGRNDFQVKIRGYRIELGELEAKLAAYEGVRDVVVVAREDTPGDKRLVVYYTTEPSLDKSPDPEDLRTYLTRMLPDYMVPAAYAKLDVFPMTLNGKLDRAALPVPGVDAYVVEPYEPPLGEIENSVAKIWAELLRLDRIGRRTDFFKAGGHSLLAVQLVSRLRSELAVEVSIADLFSDPVLSAFVQRVQAASETELPPVTKLARPERLPLSYAQRRLWFLAQMESSEAYHIYRGTRLHGPLDTAALRRALDRIVERHEVLRTTFTVSDGEPFQQVHAPALSRFHLIEHDLSSIPEVEVERDKLIAEEVRAPFDLETGPLVRGRLIREGQEDYTLIITMHHIVSDGWSMGVFMRELSVLYEAFSRGNIDPLPELEVQYPDYAIWQRTTLLGPSFANQRKYWQKTLQDAPGVLTLPCDRERAAERNYEGAVCDLVLEKGLTRRLKEFSRRRGTTLYMTLLTGWTLMLARLSGQQDIVVGTPAANRGRMEIEKLIGFFVNTLALRVDLGGSPSVRELLERVKQVSLAAQQHQDIPFEHVVESANPVRTLSHSPLFQVMFAWQSEPTIRLELDGMGGGVLQRQSTHRSAKFDMTLSLREVGGARIEGELEYASALFDGQTIERYLTYFSRLLEAMVADDLVSIDSVPLLDEGERQRLVDDGEGGQIQGGIKTHVHQLVEEQAWRTPDRVALCMENVALSYGELNRRSDRLAASLRSLGVGPDQAVGVLTYRTPEMVIGLLGVLKAGGAILPLDPDYPPERLQMMLDVGDPKVLLIQPSLVGKSIVSAQKTVLLGSHLGEQFGIDYDREVLAPDGGNVAYVIFTSGSTGKPKGVMASHEAFASHLAWRQQAFPLDHEDSFLHKASLSFDISLWEIFAPLVAGAKLVLAPPDSAKDISSIVELIANEQITISHFSPGALTAFLDEPSVKTCRNLKHVFCGGEKMPVALQQKFLSALNSALHNQYGPTETTIDVLLWNCEGTGHRRSIPIGRPIANTSAYVLDSNGQIVPAGVVGELYIGGSSLARGYIGMSGLTAESFLPNSFGKEAGARLYRTGDYVRRLAGGELEFLSRKDFQVKLRGFRIELGEIESRLREHSGVRDVVVIAREDTPGDKRLVAYYLSHEALLAEDLRTHISEKLPEYMIPAAYVRLARMPLTPNGKLDRKALPLPDSNAYVMRRYEEPVGEIESVLATVWAEVLKLDQVGRLDNFFELGGHSLLAVRLISRLRMHLGLEVTIRDLFMHPVLADLARTLQNARQAEHPPIGIVERDKPLPLSFAQQRLWFLAQMEGASEAYHIPWGVRLLGDLDVAALNSALNRIVERHEVLRTVFVSPEGEPVQQIQSVEESRFHLREHDLRQHADAPAELQRIVAEEAHEPFDLQHGPLIRGRLIRITEREHALLLTMHHIVSDGWSMGVLMKELSALYEVFLHGKPDPLPEMSLQYADYAVWQRKWMEGEVLQRQAEYWKKQLADAPPLLELPADHRRPTQPNYAGATVGIVLDEDLTRDLKELSRHHGTTLYMTLLAAWAALLGRLSGQENVVIGTPVANRGRVEIEGLIGFFVNTLALRVELGGSPTVEELLQRVRDVVVAGQQHQDIPFEQVVEIVRPARSINHHPLFQVGFTWGNRPEPQPRLANLDLIPLDMGPHLTTKFDLTLSLHDAGNGISGHIEFSTALFQRETAERYVEYLRTLLLGMVTNTFGVTQTPILSDVELEQISNGWNATQLPFNKERYMHVLFEAQVANTPDRVAVKSAESSVTYAELNRRADLLAYQLAEMGVTPEARVAICIDRSALMAVAVLAVMKAGGAFVPLDSTYPSERLMYMLQDSHPSVILTRSHLKELFGDIPISAPILDLDTTNVWNERAATAGTQQTTGLTSANLAYIIYTSGSTGRPKGVMIGHEGLTNLALAQTRSFSIDADSRVLQFASFSFDASIFEIAMALLSGACLHIAPRGLILAGDSLFHLLKVNEITHAVLPPTVLATLPTESLDHLRVLISAGEPLPASLANRWAPARHLVNAYGPTETTIWATWHDCKQHAEEIPSIGRPISNVRVYVRSASGELAPPLTAGELCIAGVSLARGYWNRPSLTADRFVPEEFTSEIGSRMYVTGDLGRWQSNGVIEYIGRNDDQVKVRGFRIELAEVTACLLSHTGIDQAVVIAQDDAQRGTELIAYYVSSRAGDKSRRAPEPQSLRNHMAKYLPDHMVPAAYIHLESLPTTVNGKLDRGALPRWDRSIPSATRIPQSDEEKLLCLYFAEVLGLESVGLDDDFFDLGGHSLLAMRLVNRIRSAFNPEFSIIDFFDAPSAAGIQERLFAIGTTRKALQAAS